MLLHLQGSEPEAFSFSVFAVWRGGLAVNFFPPDPVFFKGAFDSFCDHEAFLEVAVRRLHAGVSLNFCTRVQKSD